MSPSIRGRLVQVFAGNGLLLLLLLSVVGGKGLWQILFADWLLINYGGDDRSSSALTYSVQILKQKVNSKAFEDQELT